MYGGHRLVERGGDSDLSISERNRCQWMVATSGHKICNCFTCPLFIFGYFSISLVHIDRL